MKGWQRHAGDGNTRECSQVVSSHDGQAGDGRLATEDTRRAQIGCDADEGIREWEIAEQIGNQTHQLGVRFHEPFDRCGQWF